jgi:hypothetical protein
MEYSPLNKNINIALRSEILEYSLILEDKINELIKFSLGLLIDNEETKSFAFKSSLSFNNKLDILFDLTTITKDDMLNFQLLMIIRNRFLHDIHFSNLMSLYTSFDQGLKKRFDNFIDKDFIKLNEEVLRIACLSLFGYCMELIENSFIGLRIIFEKKESFFNTSLDLFEILFKHCLNFSNEINAILDRTKNNFDFIELRDLIYESNLQFLQELTEGEKFVRKMEFIKQFLAKGDFRIFGVNRTSES